jgi:uncharacterized protein YhdP
VADGGLADWLMSQPEFAIRHGTIRWSDALRDAPVLELTNVDLVLRNRHLGHALRINARPPAHWGGELNLQGVFKQPLLTTHPGRWQDWSGQLYTALEGVDLGQLRTYVDVGLALNQGRGSLRAWVDVQAATVTGATADVLLSDVHLGQVSAGQPVVLSRASGRLAARAIEGGHEYTTQGLQFMTADGMHWPGGNARLSLWGASAPTAAGPTASGERGELVALIARGNRTEKRRTFGAITQPVRSVLDVAAVEHRAVSGQQRRADLELRIGRIGLFSRRSRAFQQLFHVHAISSIQFSVRNMPAIVALIRFESVAASTTRKP